MTLDRIERRPFRKGEYVGYAIGAWIIRRRQGSGWSAYCQTEPTRRILFGRTLAAIADQLAAFEAEWLAANYRAP